MTAVLLSKYGTAEDLVVAQVDTPKPADDQVLVRVIASSVNSWDYDLMRGKPFYVRFDGLLKPSTKILGIDIAGIVLETGKNATRFQPGDEVFADLSSSGFGGFANYVCAPENMLAIKPPEMPFTDAAAIPHAGVLALQSLRKHGQITSDMKILFNGAGGGVGTIGLQICKSHGAEVTCVDHGDKLQALTKLGADHVIDYTKCDFTTMGHTYDLVIDMVADKAPRDYRRALRSGGRFVMVGGTTGALIRALFSRKRDKKIEILAHKPDPADLEILADMYARGMISPVLDRQFELDEVPAAMSYFGTGKAIGKVLITQKL